MIEASCGNAIVLADGGYQDTGISSLIVGILRDCQLKGDGVFWAASGVAHMHNLAFGR
jgi:hypothetical protein